MIFNTTIRTVQGGGSGDITITGGGNPFMTADGDLFMTEDGASFSVNGNDRIVDVENFPHIAPENLVYKREETRLDPDYMTRTYTQYGIPLTRNLEVFQKSDPSNTTQVWFSFEGSTPMEYLTAVRLFGLPIQGYKVVDRISDWDKSDIYYIYIIRSCNVSCVYSSGQWGTAYLQQVDTLEEARTNTSNKMVVYYGDDDEWQRLYKKTALSDVYKELTTLKSVIKGDANEVDLDILEIGSYSFYEKSFLKTVKVKETKSIGIRAFAKCWNLKLIDTSAENIHGDAFEDCHNLRAVILRGDYICNGDGTNSGTNYATDIFKNCYRLSGTVNEEYNPDGLKDGYIYVPLSVIDEYKTYYYWDSVASQFRPWVKDINELYSLDRTKYTIACCGDVEVKYNGTSWVDLR